MIDHLILDKRNFNKWIYPPRCPSCDRVLGWNEKYGPCEICRREKKPVRIHEPRCCLCGKQLESPESACCYDCGHRTHLHDGGRGIFLYREMEDVMWKFKNMNRREYAGYYGREMAKEFLRMQPLWRAQVLVPIPIHPARRRVRGYNQAELLSRIVSEQSGIPVDEHVLFRGKNTIPQRELNDKERESNLSGAFYAAEDGCGYRSVVLVDDIYTTGATINEAAKVLRRSGVRRVYFLTVCVGKGY